MRWAWSSRPLVEVIRLKRGFDLPAASRTPGTYPVVGSGGVSGWHGQWRVAGPGVTLGRAGASMGQATWVPGDFWPLNTALFVEDFLGNDPRFIYYLLSSMDFSGYDSGSSHPMLNRNYIASIPIALPSLPEQQAIAAILGSLDDTIAAHHRVAATAHALAGTGLELLLREAGAEVRTRSARLDAVACINQTRRAPDPGGRCRYLDITAISRGTITWPESMPWERAPSRARRGVRVGDILWSTVRPERRSHALVLDDDPSLVASTGLTVITPRALGPGYLYGILTTDWFVSYLSNAAEGSAYPVVPAERFDSAPIPLPPQ
ncbi:MAG: restriction endonuclease subunit S, partial [Micromonosporaceae bacterium]|nr:restriction endonuclease subunit S [Micromonosporaceae bacterium]